MDKIAERSLLYDFYGQLLTDKQREVMGLYHEENYSLSEIAAEFGISRQAVHDTLKKAEQSLTEYEEKLGLIDKFVRTGSMIVQIKEEIDRLTEAVSSTEEKVGEDILLVRLKKMKEIIASLQDD